MQYINHYLSPIGKILLSADEEGLTGLWFEEKNLKKDIDPSKVIEKNLPVFEETKRWLDLYFSGKEPDFTPPLHLIGTPFRLSIWDILLKIPYGHTTSYGEIAKIIAKKRNIQRMSAQAVGGAVGHNNISIIVPCHRVVGSDGNLIGYAGGIDRKIQLLNVEQANTEKLFLPKKGAKI